MTEPSQNLEIDRVLRRPDRTIWLVTAAHKESRSGLVATWVANASIDQQSPLVVAGLATNHRTAKLAQANRAFGLHLVSDQELELIWKFCLHSGDVYDKFAGVPYRVGATGSPLLLNSLASLDCRVLDYWDLGDRLFFVAEPIEAQQLTAAGEPLTESALLAAATPEQRRLLGECMRADIALQRPLRQAWRNRLAARAGSESGPASSP